MLDKSQWYTYNGRTYYFSEKAWSPTVRSNFDFYWSHDQFQHFYDNGQVKPTPPPGETFTKIPLQAPSRPSALVFLGRNVREAPSGDSVIIYLPGYYRNKRITFTITSVEDSDDN